MTYRTLFAALAAGLLVACVADGADWITAPSYYTHDPSTGQRVDQYSPIGPFYTYARPDFTRSGYRHLRSSIQVGNSADHMHVVEEWGQPVRPYGEWRFPFRPYSVPYAAWGPPFAGLGNSGYYPYPAPAVPYGTLPGDGGEPYDRQQPPPYYDGSYPNYRARTPGRTPGFSPGPWSPTPRNPRAYRDGRGGPGYGGPGGGDHAPGADFGRNQRDRGRSAESEANSE